MLISPMCFHCFFCAKRPYANRTWKFFVEVRKWAVALMLFKLKFRNISAMAVFSITNMRQFFFGLAMMPKVVDFKIRLKIRLVITNSAMMSRHNNFAFVLGFQLELLIYELFIDWRYQNMK